MCVRGKVENVYIQGWWEKEKRETLLVHPGIHLHVWHRSSQNLKRPIPTFESPSVFVPTAHDVTDSEMPFNTTEPTAHINLFPIPKKKKEKKYIRYVKFYKIKIKHKY